MYGFETDRTVVPRTLLCKKKDMFVFKKIISQLTVPSTLIVIFFQGCKFFPGQDIMKRIGWLGKKYDSLLKKKANIRGKRWMDGEYGEIFTVLGGKNIIFEKKGEAKISYFRQIYTPVFFWVTFRNTLMLTYTFVGGTLRHTHITGETVLVLVLTSNSTPRSSLAI